MDFMGIGPFELILILILAFLFFGPEKLPGMAAKAGRLYRNFRKATFDLSKTISEELSVEEKPDRELKTVSAPQSTDTSVSQTNTPTTVSAQTPDEKPHE